MSYVEQVDINIERNNGLYDVMGRLRVSNNDTVFVSKLDDNVDNDIWDEVTNGSASIDIDNENKIILSVSAAGDYAIRQTRRRFNYIPGKGILIKTSCLPGESVPGVIKRFGYFNTTTVAPFNSNQDGLFIEDDGTEYSVNVARNGEIQRTPQGQWNLDRLDGGSSGGPNPSGIDIDFSKVQLFAIDFAWLGVGRVRFGAVIDGVLHYFHEARHANVISTLYTRNSNHSLRYEIRSTGGASSISQICSAIEVEGSPDIPETRRAYDSSLVGSPDSQIDANSVGTLYALIGIRLKSTALDTRVVLDDFEVVETTGGSYIINEFVNPTVDGPVTWNSAGVNSAVEVAVADKVNNPSVNTISGGSNRFATISTGQRSSSVAIDEDFPLGVAIDGTPDEYWIAVKPLTQNLNFYTAVNWDESL